MTEDEFIGLVGERISHITLSENLPGIHVHGLLRPLSIARMAGAGAGNLSLREDRLQLRIGKHSARLNNQVSLRMGTKSAASFLDGHSMESWSEQLDGRIFFWPMHEGAAFAGSHDDHPTSTLLIDTRRFFQHLRPHIDLAPINTGAARRKPARRGDWIYVPATKDAEDFRANRVRLGLKKTADTASEISVRTDITAKALTAMRAD